MAEEGFAYEGSIHEALDRAVAIGAEFAASEEYFLHCCRLAYRRGRAGGNPERMFEDGWVGSYAPGLQSPSVPPEEFQP
jgi:hypothetical protein